MLKWMKNESNEVLHVFFILIQGGLPLKTNLINKNQMRFKASRISIWITNDAPILNGMWFIRPSFALNCHKLRLLPHCLRLLLSDFSKTGEFLRGNLNDCLGEIGSCEAELAAHCRSLRQWDPGLGKVPLPQGSWLGEGFKSSLNIWFALPRPFKLPHGNQWMTQSRFFFSYEGISRVSWWKLQCRGRITPA